MKWSAIADDLDIYCIGNVNGYVELMLSGSDKTPFGARYAPIGRPATYEWIKASGQTPLGMEDIAFEHLFGRWFYFRSKR